MEGGGRSAMKTCSTCKRDLPADAFYASTGNTCKACIRAYNVGRREVTNARRRERRATDPEHRARLARDNKEFYERHPGKLRERNIKVAYGITVEEYDAIMAKPCAVCGAESKHLDHRHATGQVRGALCQGCNLAAGHLKDDPWRAENLAIYLRKWSEGGG